MGLLSESIWNRIQSRWDLDNLDNSSDTQKPDLKRKRIPHTTPSMGGEFTYGPWYWRTSRSIPWMWIITADGLGKATTHVRAGLLARIFFDAYHCTVTHPARIGRDDAAMVGLRPDHLNRYFQELQAAGLVHTETKKSGKTRIIPLRPWDRKTIGKWKVPSGLWWPVISHISVNHGAQALMAYMFLAMHSTKAVAKFDRTLPGWTRPRWDFERGMAELTKAGIIRKNKIRDYDLPALRGPHPDVELRPAWFNENPLFSVLNPKKDPINGK